MPFGFVTSTGNSLLNPFPASTRAPQVSGSWLSGILPNITFQPNPTLENAARFTATRGTNYGVIQYKPNVQGSAGIFAHEFIHALQQIGPRGNLVQEIVGAVPRATAGNATPLQQVLAISQSAAASLLPGVGGVSEGANFINEFVAYGADPSKVVNRAALNIVYPNYITGPEPTQPKATQPAAVDRHDAASRQRTRRIYTGSRGGSGARRL